MASRNIFYSWQTDSDERFNRYFIEDCLKRAIRKLNREDLSDLVIDRDTKNVPGMPDIAHTILDKIAVSAVVVADLTIINPVTVRRPDERPVSNPNVLFELGYAFGKLSPQGMVGVFNTAFGSVEELPFDLRPKRLMTYWLGVGDDKAKIRAALVDDFAAAIKQSLGDTDEERIAQNSRIYRALSAVRLFGTEIEEWYGLENLPNVMQNHVKEAQEVLDVMIRSGSTDVAQNMAGKLKRDLANAAGLALNEENWPTIKQIILSAGQFAGLLLRLLGYKIEPAYHDETVSGIVKMPSELVSHIESLQNGKLRKTELEALAHDLRMASFLPLMPQHPQFAAGVGEISLHFRRLVLRWARTSPKTDEAINAIQDVHDRLMQLIDKYAPRNDLED